MQDIKLEPIKDISDEYINYMTYVRREFILLDKVIQNIIDKEKSEDSPLQSQKLSQATRCASIARTNLETASQYSIKSLCILGER